MPGPDVPTRRVTRSAAAAATLPPKDAKPKSEFKKPKPLTKSRPLKTRVRSTELSERPSKVVKDTKDTKEREPDELDIALANFKQVQEDKKKLDLKEVQALKKKFKSTVDTTKRETEALERQRLAKPQAGKTRSGMNRLVAHKAVYTHGKWVNKGLDDSQDTFDESELEYLKDSVGKFKQVSDLKFEHLKYLVVDVFLDELKGIKDAKIESNFHERYVDLKGKSKTDMFAEVRTSLFTNEQRDYINGLLQGAFDTTSKDDNGDIKHSDINYVEIVMLAEITIRIVKYVHKFKSNEEAFEFMIKSSREAHGLGDDDDD